MPSAPTSSALINPASSDGSCNIRRTSRWSVFTHCAQQTQGQTFVHDVDLPDFSFLPGPDEGDVDDGSTSTLHSKGVTFFRTEITKLVSAGSEDPSSSYVVPTVLLITFVVTSCADPVMKAASRIPASTRPTLKSEHFNKDYGYEPASVIFLTSLVSVITGNVISCCNLGLHRGLRRCWHVPTLARCFIPASLFNCAQILKFMALLYLPVDMAVLLDQMSLVLLAIISRIILKKMYDPAQYCTLVITSTAMLQYVMLSDAHHSKAPQEIHDPTDLSHNLHVGAMVMLIQVVVSVLAQALTEKLLKAGSGAGLDDDLPFFFWEQKAHLEFGGGVATLFYCCVIAPRVMGNKQVVNEGLLSGWTIMTVFVMCTLLVKLWLAGLIAKVLNSVVKQMGSCCAMVCTYFIQLWLPPPIGKRGKMEFYTDVVVALGIVALSVSSFALTTSVTHKLTAKENQLQNIVQLANIRISSA